MSIFSAVCKSKWLSLCFVLPLKTKLPSKSLKCSLLPNCCCDGLLGNITFEKQCHLSLVNFSAQSHGVIAGSCLSNQHSILHRIVFIEHYTFQYVGCFLKGKVLQENELCRSNIKSLYGKLKNKHLIYLSIKQSSRVTISFLHVNGQSVKFSTMNWV